MNKNQRVIGDLPQRKAHTGKLTKILFAVFFAVTLSFITTSTAFAQQATQNSTRSIKLSSLVTPQSASRHIRAPSILGSSEQMSNNTEEFTKWTSMLMRYEKQMRSSESATFKAWFQRLDYLKDADIKVKLRQVNNIVNLNRYVTDMEGYGMSDHWATPVEMINNRFGDCEDYAITKMMTLKALGVSESAMRVVVVQDMYKGIAHAILVVYANGTSYVLDNQIPEVVETSAISHYKPVYSISRFAWWRHYPDETLVANR